MLTNLFGSSMGWPMPLAPLHGSGGNERDSRRLLAIWRQDQRSSRVVAASRSMANSRSSIAGQIGRTIMAAALLLTRLMGRNGPTNFYRAGSFSIPDIPHAPARAEDRR